MPRSLVPPPADRFSGPFAEFYRAHVEPNLPSPAAVRAIHDRIARYVNDERTTLFVARKFEGRLRGNRLPTHDPDLSLVCGDNEPALWFYARAFLEDFEQRLPSVAQAVESRAFPIGFARRATAGERADFWPNWGKERWEDQSFSGSRLYHAHLFDAAQGIASHRLDRENLRQRMVRFLHPANHFPMPTHHGAVFYSCDGAHTDLSELPGIKRFIAEQFAQRYREVWSEFLALAGGDPDLFPRVEKLHFTCVRREGRSETPSLPRAEVARATPPVVRRVISESKPPPGDPLLPLGDTRAAATMAPVLQPGDLVVRASRAGAYRNQWNQSLLTVLHTHARIKSAIERVSRDGRPVFVQDQDRTPRKVTSFGFLSRVEELADGSFKVHFERVSACDYPGSARQPPGFYYVA